MQKREQLLSGDRHAFTLIELLIVIAIIAILALIAVPNFLEAQVRSKVSRVRADMRSIATAIEAYAVDWGGPPLSGQEYTRMEGKAGWPAAGQHGALYVYRQLTTPQAYITSIPRDPFTEKGKIGPQTNVNPFAPTVYFGYAALRPAKEDWDWARYGMETYGVNNQRSISYRMGYNWVLFSFGPSRTNQSPADDVDNGVGIWMITSGKADLYVYDPTNGTVSEGFIFRTNKGEYTGHDYRLFGT